MKRYLGFLLMFLASIAHAYPEDRALDNLSEDYADCVSYFTVMVVDAGRNKTEQPDKGWSTIESNYKDATIKAIGMLRYTMVDLRSKPEAFVKSKLDLHMQLIEKTLKDEGLDRLMYLYMNQCKQLMEDPKPRLQYWIDKK